MSGLQQVLKAFCLFIVGCYIKGVLLDQDSSIFVDTFYYLVIINIAFAYAMSFKHQKLPPNDFTVLITGAGFSGIAMGVKLKELGIKFRIIEKEKRLGGTWLLNTYPGCACDVPSHIYSYSFCLNPSWTRSYSKQSEILRYIEDLAEKYKVTDHIEFGKKVVKSTWDEDSKKWITELDDGEIIHANIAITAVGGLHIPNIPTFPGVDNFKGETFHSAQWPYNYDPTGKKVAIIGTGASAVQIVPAIAKKVSHLTVFQRTPCWVPPKDDARLPSWLKAIFAVFPPLMYLLRCLYFWRGEFYYMSIFRMDGFLRKRANRLIKRYYSMAVKDPKIREKLIPNFEMGCKRVTPSNTYLQSFNRSNVTLETTKIKCFVENGIQTADGKIQEVDTIIYATGFDVMATVRSVNIYGRKKETSIVDEWGNNPNAYKGISYPGYPNAFMLLGPGTGLGHNTILFMIECQIGYVIDAIKSMVNQNIKSIEVRKEVNDRYQSWARKAMENKVFVSDTCVSYYKNSDGVAFALWPSHLTHYWWKTRKIDLKDFVCNK